MSENEIRVAVARVCGWHRIAEVTVGRSGNQRMVLKGVHPQTSLQCELPNFPASLDAMAEAEKVLTDEEWVDYCAELVNRAPTFPQYGLGSGTDKARRLASATAARKAEAFLRCLGKWT